MHDSAAFFNASVVWREDYAKVALSQGKNKEKPLALA